MSWSWSVVPLCARIFNGWRLDRGFRGRKRFFIVQEPCLCCIGTIEPHICILIQLASPASLLNLLRTSQTLVVPYTQQATWPQARAWRRRGLRRLHLEWEIVAITSSRANVMMPLLAPDSDSSIANYDGRTKILSIMLLSMYHARYHAPCCSAFLARKDLAEERAALHKRRLLCSYIPPRSLIDLSS
jgi:hypothetical protein